MRRAVFADADAVMRKDIRDRQAHECCEARHRLRVIRKDEERRDVRAQAAVERDAVRNRRHRELADAEMQVAPLVILFAEVALILHVRLVRRCEVGTAAKELRQLVLQAVDHDAGKAARRLRLVLIRPELFVAEQRLCIDRCVELIPECLCLRELRCIVCKELVPNFFGLCALLCEFSIMRIDIVRDVEALIRLRPAEIFLKRLDILDAERLAMGAGLALLCRAAIADFRLDRDERRMLLVRFRLFDGLADGCEVVAILDRDRLEAECLHALLHVLAERDVRAALDGDAVAVIEDDELREAERTRE